MFISHDLAVVHHISHKFVVMYLGLVIEEAPTSVLFQDPQHPYTKTLLDAVPVVNPRLKRERELLKGEPPNPADPPKGCPFNTRCHLVHTRYHQERPELKFLADNHKVAFFAKEPPYSHNKESK
jgi:peptide/nickel transport system ATP-binding protein